MKRYADVPFCSNPIKTRIIYIKRFPIPTGIVCGAYAIRPYTGTKMLCDNSLFSIPPYIVCGAYTIRPYPDTKMLCDDSFFLIPTGIVCGAYAIRPYPDTKMLCDDSFFPIPTGIVYGAYAIRPYPTGWKKKVSKCFCDAFWGSKSNQNILEVLFEAQNWVKMLLRCFLRLKIESKCSWGAFWGSKWSPNAFEVLFEAKNWVQMLLKYFLRLKIESKYFWGTFWGSKWSESVFEVYLLRKMGDKETAGLLLLRCPAVKQSFWVLRGTQNAVGGYLLLIDTSMRLPWESSWLAKSRTDSMVRALTFFS